MILQVFGWHHFFLIADWMTCCQRPLLFSLNGRYRLMIIKLRRPLWGWVLQAGGKDVCI